MKTILVTGGAGFIGSHLSAKLLEQGNQVICLDNFLTGKEENIHQLLSNKNFILKKHDVEQSYHFKVDEIYNLACPAAPRWYKKDPVKTVRTNILGAINALELAKEINCRVLQVSTSEVYGDPQIHPQTESYWGNVNPVGLRACYDEGKRCAETLFFNYYREYNVDIKVVRVFNTYGPRMTEGDGRVVPNFILQALRGDDLTVYGDGRQTRSFCYIDDMVSGLLLMMSKANFTGPVNLGNPLEYSINDLAQIIIHLTNSRSRIVNKELPADDPTKRRPDISLAKEELNWQPTVSLEEGLIKCIAYYEFLI